MVISTIIAVTALHVVTTESEPWRESAIESVADSQGEVLFEPSSASALQKPLTPGTSDACSRAAQMKPGPFSAGNVSTIPPERTRSRLMRLVPSGKTKSPRSSGNHVSRPPRCDHRAYSTALDGRGANGAAFVVTLSMRQPRHHVQRLPNPVADNGAFNLFAQKGDCGWTAYLDIIAP